MKNQHYNKSEKWKNFCAPSFYYTVKLYPKRVKLGKSKLSFQLVGGSTT